MGVGQTTFAPRMPAGFPGQLTEEYFNRSIHRGKVVEAAGIGFGLACVYDAASTAPLADVSIATAAAVAGQLFGVSVVSNFAEQTAGDASYEENCPIGVLVRGTIHVASETAFAMGDSVYVRTDGSGLFRNDDTGAVLVPNATVWVAGGANEAVIELH